MARVLTGIQSSGRPHLGNILGAIVPAIQLIEQNSKEESFIFIADFHSLTSQKDGAIRKQNTLAVAAAWLAFGLDIEKTVFYRTLPHACQCT
jgi:tryptophanyl-tRNA synthetase